MDGFNQVINRSIIGNIHTFLQRPFFNRAANGATFIFVYYHTIDCISFNVYLDENAVGLKFDVKNPAPIGVEYYQVNCGSLIPLGEFVCLQGGTAYTVTFCMAGADRPDYIIESIAGATVTDTIMVKNDYGAFENFHVDGLDSETINWSVTYPLNSEHLIDYLDITDPENPIFSPGTYAPSRITYSVCGTLKDVKCESLPVIDCATIDVTILSGNNSLHSVIDTIFCEGPETFIWNGLTILTDRDSSYSHNFASSPGYDSIVTLNTFVIPATTIKSTIIISDTELPFVWNGNEYNACGVYDIFRTNSFGCDSLLTLELNVEYESVTDVGTYQQKGLNCNVFPNPSDGDLNISFSGNINSDIKVDAIDVSGRLVKGFLFENFPGIEKVSLDMQELESGIYYLIITANEERITKEVIIE